jgi:translation initiation factor 1A
MPKNKKRAKNKKTTRNVEAVKRDIVFKNHEEEYAVVLKKLGDRRLTVRLVTGQELLAVIPGRFRKRCWIDVDDLILVSFRQFQENKVDVIHKYNSDEKRALARLDEIPPTFATTRDVGDEADAETCAFEFDFDADFENI